MIKPDAYMEMGKVIDCIYASGFKLNRLKMSRFSKASVAQFYAEHVGKPFFPNLEGHMTSDVAIGIELVHKVVQS